MNVIVGYEKIDLNQLFQYYFNKNFQLSLIFSNLVNGSKTSFNNLVSWFRDKS